jgi:hypothetical protein
MTFSDISANIKIYNIDINRCTVFMDCYFATDEPVRVDEESRIIPGYLEQSNVSAFKILLEMRYILIKHAFRINNVNFILDNIQLLMLKLDEAEDENREKNWRLIEKWLPYLDIETGSEYI